jgi:hypothetical protein
MKLSFSKGNVFERHGGRERKVSRRPHSGKLSSLGRVMRKILKN